MTPRPQQARQSQKSRKPQQILQSSQFPPPRRTQLTRLCGSRLVFQTHKHGRLTAGVPAGAERRASGMLVMRTCVGCKERAVKSSLLRLVAVGDVIQPDPQARLPGRGAYLYPSLAYLELARRHKAFPRALRTTGSLGLAVLAEYLCGAQSPALHC